VRCGVASFGLFQGGSAPTKRQKFTSEYKLEAVRLSNEGTKSVATVAAQLGIDKHQLYSWGRTFERNGNSSFPGNGKISSQDEELHHLGRQLKVVTGERDFRSCPEAWCMKTLGGLPVSAVNDGGDPVEWVIADGL
jgi:transposase